MIHFNEYDGGYEDTPHQSDLHHNIQYLDEGDAILLVPENTKISPQEKIDLAQSIPPELRIKIEGAIGMYMYTFPSHPITVVYYFDSQLLADAPALMRQSMQDFFRDADLPQNAIIIGLVV